MPIPRRKPGARVAPAKAPASTPKRRADPGLDLGSTLDEMASLKAEARAFHDSNGGRFSYLEELAIKTMRKLGIRSYRGDTVTGTLVEGSTPSIDWKGIEEAMTPEQWRQVTQRVGQANLLGKFLEQSKDPKLVAKLRKLITASPKKPYVLVTVSAPVPPDDGEPRPTRKSVRRKPNA